MIVITVMVVICMKRKKMQDDEDLMMMIRMMMRMMLMMVIMMMMMMEGIYYDKVHWDDTFSWGVATSKKGKNCEEHWNISSLISMYVGLSRFYAEYINFISQYFSIIFLNLIPIHIYLRYCDVCVCIGFLQTCINQIWLFTSGDRPLNVTIRKTWLSFEPASSAESVCNFHFLAGLQAHATTPSEQHVQSSLHSRQLRVFSRFRPYWSLFQLLNVLNNLLMSILSKHLVCNSLYVVKYKVTFIFVMIKTLI